MKSLSTKRWSGRIRRVADFDNSTEQSGQMRKNKSKTSREISTFHYRSVRFSANDSDLLAFRVICHDPNTIKTKTITRLEWVIFSYCRQATFTFPVYSSEQPVVCSETIWQALTVKWQDIETLLKPRYWNQGRLRKNKKNILCVQFEARKNLIITITLCSRVTFEFGLLWGNFAGTIWGPVKNTFGFFF